MRQPVYAIFLSAILLAACSATPGSGAGAPRAGVGVFSGRLHLRGEITVDGTFTDDLTSRHESCGAYVRGIGQATTLWVVPSPTTALPVDGHAVQYTAGVPSSKPSTGYRGAGRYSGPSATVPVLIVDQASFLPGDHASTVISVAASGDGTMSFSGLVDVDTNARESGDVTWSCAG